MPMTTRGKGQGRPTMYKASPLAALVRKKKKTNTTSVRPTKALTAAVQRIVNKKIETKYVQYKPYNRVFGTLDRVNFTQAINSSNEAYSLIPPVTLGPGDHQRNGTVIMPTSLTVKGFVSLIENDLRSQLCDVDIYILRHKAIKDVQYETQLGNFTDLVNLGDGTNGQYDGSWVRSACPINTSTYTVIAHKKIRLEKAYGDANCVASGANESVAAYNTSRHQRNFSIKIKMPKKLQYKNDTDITPSMDYPFMVIGWNVPTNLDTNSSIESIRASASTHLYYKDG